jgi:probable DNA metabolism protein
MLILLHDGTFDGLLTAIDQAFTHPDDCEIHDKNRWQPSLFDPADTVTTQPDRADDLYRKVQQSAGKAAGRNLMYAFCSEQPDIETALLHYVREALRLGKQVNQYHANPHIREILAIARKVGNEIHRFQGLIRFRELEDGTLWGPFEPDHDILIPLAGYFRRRMGPERWILHDLKRNRAMAWDGQRLRAMSPDDQPDATPAFSPAEEVYAQLWKTFHHSIAVRERANPRLQRQNMPQRYWKHLVEMQPSKG